MKRPGLVAPGRLWRLLPVILLPLLAAWLLRQAPLAAIGQTLSSVQPAALAGLVAFNLLVLLVFSSRWWLILQALGWRLPYLAVLRYRCAAFAINYFTPGPQFGGEPLQVVALQNRHGLPGSTAAASVTLEKLFELLSNFTFLAIGLGVTLSGPKLAALPAWQAALWVAALAALPLAYLLLLVNGRAPLSGLAARLPGRLAQRAQLQAAPGFLSRVENEAGGFLRHRPAAVLAAVLAGGLIWAFALAEYWLALYVFGARLDLRQAITALTVARLAFLTPLPAGLGALEAGQVLALQSMGFSPALGVAVSLWIRARDLAVGLGGLWLGAGLLRPIQLHIRKARE